MFKLFKKKQTTHTCKLDDDEQKKCEEENGDSCPMCHVSDDVVNQLKDNVNGVKKEKR